VYAGPMLTPRTRIFYKSDVDARRLMLARHSYLSADVFVTPEPLT
jgi:hypothetical protein